LIRLIANEEELKKSILKNIPRYSLKALRDDLLEFNLEESDFNVSSYA